MLKIGDIYKEIYVYSYRRTHRSRVVLEYSVGVVG
jgi:hypothetical protein